MRSFAIATTLVVWVFRETLLPSLFSFQPFATARPDALVYCTHREQQYEIPVFCAFVLLQVVVVLPQLC